jgi:hypothetical protein
MVRNLFTLLFFISCLDVFAQTKVEIANKSFEDFPNRGERFLSLKDWTDCGSYRFPGQTPPDIHPGNFWSSNNPPSHGNTYIGMVVRDNDTWEGIGQRLTTKLEVGKCYKLTADLARSKKYLSKSQLTNKEMNYIQPAVFTILTSNKICHDKEILAESTAVDHEDWRTYQFKIKPTSDYSFILIEAFYLTPVKVPYCGHILVDNLSDFEEIDCAIELEVIVGKPSKQ